MSNGAHFGAEAECNAIRMQEISIENREKQRKIDKICLILDNYFPATSCITGRLETLEQIAKEIVEII